MSADSGRLAVLPGTHRSWRDDDYAPVEPPASFGTALPPSKVDAGQRVEFDLQPGDVVFFDEAVVSSFAPSCSGC